MLAVGREDEVLRAAGPAHADLRGLLAEQRGPQAELALALQGVALSVDAAHEHHVLVETAQILVGELCSESVVFSRADTFAFGSQHLDHSRA